MNKQQTKTSRGIEWTDYTWNPVAGCAHACRWEMPDGSIAKCYAESVAEGVARSAYPQGFKHHYWYPDRLEEPLSLKTPSRIFLDSMSDLMGISVPDDQIEAVLDVCRRAHWHTFQLLTKNAPRLRQFKFPSNVWVGASMPPSQMFGQPLNAIQQQAMLRRTLTILDEIDAPVRWMSFEPLSWDVAPIVVQHRDAIQWAVIGAATNGSRVYQPDLLHVMRLMSALSLNTAIFFKGNLRGNPAANTWLEQFPAVAPTAPAAQLSMFGD